jgi:hypothetical protein
MPYWAHSKNATFNSNVEGGVLYLYSFLKIIVYNYIGAAGKVKSSENTIQSREAKKENSALTNSCLSEVEELSRRRSLERIEKLRNRTS